MGAGQDSNGLILLMALVTAGCQPLEGSVLREEEGGGEVGPSADYSTTRNGTHI